MAGLPGERVPVLGREMVCVGYGRKVMSLLNTVGPSQRPGTRRMVEVDIFGEKNFEIL